MCFVFYVVVIVCHNLLMEVVLIELYPTSLFGILTGKQTLMSYGFRGSLKATAFHCTQLHKFLRQADGNNECSQFFILAIALSMKFNGWICNMVEEMEPLGLQLLRKYLQSPISTVGRWSLSDCSLSIHAT